jgi:hypothetical protein
VRLSSQPCLCQEQGELIVRPIRRGPSSPPGSPRGCGSPPRADALVDDSSNGSSLLAYRSGEVVDPAKSGIHENVLGPGAAFISKHHSAIRSTEWRTYRCQHSFTTTSPSQPYR